MTEVDVTTWLSLALFVGIVAANLLLGAVFVRFLHPIREKMMEHAQHLLDRELLSDSERDALADVIDDATNPAEAIMIALLRMPRAIFLSVVDAFQGHLPKQAVTDDKLAHVSRVIGLAFVLSLAANPIFGLIVLLELIILVVILTAARQTITIIDGLMTSYLRPINSGVLKNLPGTHP